MTNGMEKMYQNTTVKPITVQRMTEVMVEVMKEVNNLDFERRNYVAQMLLMEEKCYAICKAEGILYDEGVHNRKKGV
jgi:hypothetical protein